MIRFLFVGEMKVVYGLLWMRCLILLGLVIRYWGVWCIRIFLFGGCLIGGG